MKLHTLLVVMLLAATATFADLSTPSTIITKPKLYVEKFEAPVTLTNVLVSCSPHVRKRGQGSFEGNHTYRLELTTTNGINSIYMSDTGVFDVDLNVAKHDIITVELYKIRPNGKEKLLKTKRYTYEWNIPEPATIGLILSGGFVLMIARRFKKV